MEVLELCKKYINETYVVNTVGYCTGAGGFEITYASLIDTHMLLQNCESLAEFEK